VDGEGINSRESSGIYASTERASKAESRPARFARWKQQAQGLQREAHICYFVCRHPRSSWKAKAVAAATAGYVLSPIQLIPNFIPVIGFLDDLLILFVGVKLLRWITPPDTMAECRELADAAKMRREEQVKSRASAIVPVAIIVLWVLAVAAANALLIAWIAH
jgi:uncharacterized membrane protein YkvA (DUF1232 family)